ncbi:MAG: hypothetical protein IPP96_14020 [Chitinophagaceae bacterium]|nr:hypothetical protein [Chitinophagaceae bacterium]
MVKPQQHIQDILQHLPIDIEMVAKAPAFDDEIADTLFEMEEAVFVAHNVNFDYSFIKHQLQQSKF